MQCPGHQFLPGTRFASNKDGDVRGRDFSHHLVNVLHRLAGADQGPVQLVMVLDLLLKTLHLFRNIGGLPGFQQDGVKRLEVERLGDVVIGAVLHRFHGVFHGRLGRHDHHQDFRTFLEKTGEKLQPRYPRHLDIKDCQIVTLLPEKFKGLGSVHRHIHAESLLCKGFGQDPADAFFVIGDPNAADRHNMFLLPKWIQRSDEKRPFAALPSTSSLQRTSSARLTHQISGALRPDIFDQSRETRELARWKMPELFLYPTT